MRVPLTCRRCAFKGATINAGLECEWLREYVAIPRQIICDECVIRVSGGERGQAEGTAPESRVTAARSRSGGSMPGGHVRLPRRRRRPSDRAGRVPLTDISIRRGGAREGQIRFPNHRPLRLNQVLQLAGPLSPLRIGDQAQASGMSVAAEQRLREGDADAGGCWRGRWSRWPIRNGDGRPQERTPQLRRLRHPPHVAFLVASELAAPRGDRAAPLVQAARTRPAGIVGEAVRPVIDQSHNVPPSASARPALGNDRQACRYAQRGAVSGLGRR